MGAARPGPGGGASLSPAGDCDPPPGAVGEGRVPLLCPQPRAAPRERLSARRTAPGQALPALVLA